jgi:hypothetical protein
MTGIDVYLFIKITLGVVATIALYTVLARENAFYRFFEHIFLGLAVGWSIVAITTEVLIPLWWEKMVGVPPDGTTPGTPGFFLYVLLLPIGLMGYFVFSPKYNWMSRVPIGIILGLWAGQQVQVWWVRYGPQIQDSMKTMLPTTWSSFTVPSGQELTPEQAAEIAAQVYPSQAISNIIFVFTLLAVLSYFLFSFEAKNKAFSKLQLYGRWLMMIGFGAIFGSTVMTRFALLIDRMYFIWIEWLRDSLIPLLMRPFGGS